MHEEIKELTLWELYFSFKGRLSKNDFGYYYLLPTLALSCLFVFIVIFFDFSIASGDLFETSISVVFIYFIIFLSVMAYGKRSRDFNMPCWFGLLPFFILGLVYSSPIIIPALQYPVNAFSNSDSTGLGIFITLFYWFTEDKDQSLYGPECKVVLFKAKDAN